MRMAGLCQFYWRTCLFIFYGRLMLRPRITEVRETFTRGGPWVWIEKLLLGFFLVLLKLQGGPKSDEIWNIFRPRTQTFCSHARMRQNIVILKKKLVKHRWLLYTYAIFGELWPTNPWNPRVILLFFFRNLLSRPNSVEYGNSKTTTLLPSAKCTRPLFQGRTGCGGRPSGWHDIVTCQRLV